MAGWGRCETWHAGCTGLGQAGGLTSPEAYRGLPAPTDRIGFVAAGRVDNLEELRRQLSTPGLQSPHADSDLIYRAYLTWGEDCARRIYGDWSFAAWHPVEQRLFVARDHFGHTSLYYYADERVFAFASERRSLLALNLAPMEMDELYLAQVLIAWPAYHGNRTILRQLHQLPPAHTLTVTSERHHLRQYWHLEDTPVLRLPHREDYIPAFREVFDEAVRARLRSPIHDEESPGAKNSIAVTLSGGLDSGSVTATAARLLQPACRRLTAFTSVPLSDTSIYVGKRFGDEFPLAKITAEFVGNVDHVAITAATITPIQAIRRMLEIHAEPGHAAGNFFWMHDLHRTAAMQGHRILLSGACGNAGTSWAGDVFSQPLDFQLSTKGYRALLKERLKRIMPFELMKIWHRHHISADWCRSSAIHPGFAERLHLLERRLNDITEQPRTPLEERCQFLLPGRSSSGAFNAEEGAAHGLEIRDPTADARVLAFTFSVPDDVFIDPKTGLNRWLIRAAMKDRLPDVVRLNRKRGTQAGDLVPRLRASAGEVNAALEELARGPAAEYVDVPYMRKVWEIVQTQDTPKAFHKSASVLTRGIMAGLWVNDFFIRGTTVPRCAVELPDLAKKECR